jgi:hypothetical protein
MLRLTLCQDLELFLDVYCNCRVVRLIPKCKPVSCLADFVYSQHYEEKFGCFTFNLLTRCYNVAKRQHVQMQ